MEAFEFMKAVKQMRNDDIVIACMAPSSGGKDLFMDLLFNQEVQHDNVDEIQVTRIKHPNPIYDDRIVLLNTPGFDATTSDADIAIASMTKDWLKQSYSNDVSLTGVIYVHSIADSDAFNSLSQNLPLFGELCGWGRLSHVTLVSTMWDEVQPEVGIAREQELRSLFLRSLADNRLSICRLEKETPEEAWNIVNNLITDRNERESTLLQQKLIGFGIQLDKTETGREIYASFRQLVLDHGEHVQSILAQIDTSDNPVELKKLRREYVGIRDSFQTVLKGVKGMGIRPGKMIMNPFFEWRVRAKASQINSYLDLTSPAPLTDYPYASEFDESTLQSFSEAGQSEDADQTLQISATLVDICENVTVQRFITGLTGDDAQCMTDFLNHVVGLEDVKASDRRLILFLMWKLAKSANVFPKYHDDNDAPRVSTQPLGVNTNLDDEWRASRTAKVDFQRAFSLVATVKGQEKVYDEVKSPRLSRLATISPTLSHSTDSHVALPAPNPESPFDLLVSVSTACAIQDLSLVPYPEGIQGPDSELNTHVQNGKFRYDRDFLLQFMAICKARPVALPPIDQLGIKVAPEKPAKKGRLSQKTASTNQKCTSNNPLRSPSKSPELPTINTLRSPLSPNEKLTDLNYYLPIGSHDNSVRSRSDDWLSPNEDTELQVSQLAANATDNSDIPFMLRDVPGLKNRKRGVRRTVAAPPTITQVHEAATAGEPAWEEGRSQHTINVARGSSKRIDIWRDPPSANQKGWAAAIADNLKATKQPSPKIGLYNFGQFDKFSPTALSPGGVFVGRKDQRKSPFRAN